MNRTMSKSLTKTRATESHKRHIQLEGRGCSGTQFSQDKWKNLRNATTPLN